MLIHIDKYYYYYKISIELLQCLIKNDKKNISNLETFIIIFTKTYKHVGVRSLERIFKNYLKYSKI